VLLAWLQFCFSAVTWGGRLRRQSANLRCASCATRRSSSPSSDFSRWNRSGSRWSGGNSHRQVKQPIGDAARNATDGRLAWHRSIGHRAAAMDVCTWGNGAAPENEPEASRPGDRGRCRQQGGQAALTGGAARRDGVRGPATRRRNKDAAWHDPEYRDASSDSGRRGLLVPRRS
jgi:hypothetical protein